MVNSGQYDIFDKVSLTFIKLRVLGKLQEEISTIFFVSLGLRLINDVMKPKRVEEHLVSLIS